MSDRERKVRGRKIRSDRTEKELQKASKQTARAPGESAAPEADPAPEPFVRTDEIDALAERLGGWLDADRPVHLVGPTGSGKTVLARHVAAERGRPVVVIRGDESLDATDLVGEYAGEAEHSVRDAFVSNVVKETSIVRDRWVDNPLSVAVRAGATLVYDEYSRSPPDANNVLLAALEEGVLERPGRRGEDRTVEVHPEFRAILTSNTVEYAGVNQPQDALLDRLVEVDVGYYEPDTEAEIVAAHVDLDRDRIDEIVGTIRTLRDELDSTVGTRAAIVVAEGYATFDDPEPVELYADALAPTAGIERTELRERLDAIV